MSLSSRVPPNALLGLLTILALIVVDGWRTAALALAAAAAVAATRIRFAAHAAAALLAIVAILAVVERPFGSDERPAAAKHRRHHRHGH